MSIFHSPNHACSVSFVVFGATYTQLIGMFIKLGLILSGENEGEGRVLRGLNV